MAADREATFRRAIEAFNAWDFEALTAVLTADFEFVPFLAARSRRGRTGVTRASASTGATPPPPGPTLKCESMRSGTPEIA